MEGGIFSKRSMGIQLDSGKFSHEYFSSGTYADYEAYVESWANRVLRKIHSLTREKKDIKILDVGCAHGYFLAKAKKASFKIGGLEYSNFAIKKAEVSVQKEIRKGSILERGNFPKNHADVVLCFDVCEYLPEPSIMKAVQNLAHWTKEYIFFTDIYKHSKWASYTHNPDPNRITTLSQKEYIDIFRMAGVKLYAKWDGGTGCDILIFKKLKR